ncbi:MAG: methyltransferase domain-containing protein [Thermosynechococcaceae cyanobacterium MS004]|nr:methyltransferase domain-containing protein [Thermosynechococcaceae cyanobacterium MS004]
MIVETQARALESAGSSSAAVYQMVSRVLSKHHKGGGTLIDVGCGSGQLWHYINQKCDHYIGVDINQYDGFPEEAHFFAHNFDNGQIPLNTASADVVVSVETIEHLENPRAFVRDLARICKPEGFVIVTTPNQLSLLSKLTMLLKNEFNAFQEAPGLYPSHITALLEIDLRRIFIECGLADIDVKYTDDGRIPFTSMHWPRSLHLKGRRFSDNILCIGRKNRIEALK